MRRDFLTGGEKSKQDGLGSGHYHDDRDFHHYDDIYIHWWKVSMTQKSDYDDDYDDVHFLRPYLDKQSQN